MSAQVVQGAHFAYLLAEEFQTLARSTVCRATYGEEEAAIVKIFHLEYMGEHAQERVDLEVALLKAAFP